MTTLQKIALVTGASRGIGRATALKLAQDGFTVAVHYNTATKEAQKTIEDIISAGGKAFLIQADLSVSGSAKDLVKQFLHQLSEHRLPQQLHVLVNNAGIGGRKQIEDVSEAEFDQILQVNLKSPFFIIQGLLPYIADHGRIINVSSMGTRVAYPGMSVYAPSKAGLEALTLLLAQQLGERGITVNSVLPGATATDLNARARDPKVAQEIAATVALKRVGQPEDIAATISLLASEDARWITGQQIDASGGQRI